MSGSGANLTLLENGPGYDIDSVGQQGSGILTFIANQASLVVDSPSGLIVLGYYNTGAGTLNIGTGGAPPSEIDVAAVSGGGTPFPSNDGTAVVNFNQNSTYTFTPQLTGSLAVNLIGSGTTIFAQNETYTGITTISQGQLTVNGGGVHLRPRAT